MDPDTLLARARKLDEQALAEIHDRHYPDVYRYVRYRLDDDQLVEDIAAEVFLRFLDALNRRNTEIREVRAWLFGTAANLINDHLRRKYRRRDEDLSDYEAIPSGETTEAQVERNDHQGWVRHAMQKLTADQQQVITLRFLMECSIEETARVMRKTEGAVKVLQFRALASLRRLIESREER